MGMLGGMQKMLLMYMHVGDWPVPLKFKVLKIAFGASFLPSVAHAAQWLLVGKEGTVHHSCTLDNRAPGAPF